MSILDAFFNVSPSLGYSILIVVYSSGVTLLIAEGGIAPELTACIASALDMPNVLANKFNALL